MNETNIIESNPVNTKPYVAFFSLIGAIVFAIAFWVNAWGDEDVAIAMFVIGALIIIVSLVFYYMVKSCEIYITDKRIYGTAGWGKRVDLPLDSVSAVGAGWLKSISVATSSGSISFLAIENRDEIHEALSNLLIERQNKVAAVAIKQDVPPSTADELKKFKELLDMGVITQEEFDAKKKQLLGL